MDYDVIIRGGTVIDGTGAYARRADVGIQGQRIAAIGDLSTATAGSIIGTTDRIVAPGFIDVHTHVDAQVFWDTTVSPSPLHGVDRDRWELRVQRRPARQEPRGRAVPHADAEPGRGDAAALPRDRCALGLGLDCRGTSTSSRTPCR
ncbi:MAG: hypothetical protein R2705_18015 [Ilumatobacteraceae bacterium]